MSQTPLHEEYHAILATHLAWLGRMSPAAHAVHTSGRTWRGARAARTPGPKRQCFDNAYQRAARSRHLHYIEGWALSGDLGIPLPIHHAWLIDARTGTVVDPTWTPHADSHYSGLLIPLEWVRDYRARTRGASVAVLDGWPVQQDWHDGLLAAAQEATTAQGWGSPLLALEATESS